MACPDAALLDRYLSGRTTRDEESGIEVHLETCATCAEALRSPEAEDLVGELRSALADLPPGRSALPCCDSAGEPVGAAPDLGRYRIIGRIGEGGMGIVYEAEQKTPRRKVALKVLRPLVSARSAIERFRLEAEVLGRLEHPGIARIYEAGTLDTGSGPQPFLTMELVTGRPVDEHARERGLGLRDRVRLVARICSAVQHAHQKGVVHRDLKPPRTCLWTLPGSRGSWISGSPGSSAASPESRRRRDSSSAPSGT